MNYFNYLPPEIIVTIFKKLNLNDLINLKSVDKRFKEISEQIKIKELFVYTNNYYYGRKCDSKLQYWFYTNDSTYFDKENMIYNYHFPYYKTKLQLDRNLKRLFIDIEFFFDLSSLNEFKLLEHLSIMVVDHNCYCELNLENLKIFEINRQHGCESFTLTFNTNKLFAFKSFDMKFDDFVFKYPDKILFYETDNYSYDDKISIFNNLQYLKLTRLFEPIDRDILSKFKKLKTLDLKHNYFREEIRFINLMNDINFLINQKENLKRSELQIYFNGVELINQDKLNQLKWSSNSNELYSNLLEFQIKNYDLLKDNCDNCVINYCDLIKLIQVIPSSFINKFQRIKKVNANDHIGNEDQFIKFLNDLPYLTELELIDCELTKSFYKKLINLVYLNNLESLKIKEKDDLKINFNFIVNLKRLEYFVTNQKINNIESVRKLFKINDDIRKFCFKISSKNHIKIKKDSSKFRIDSYYLDDNLKKVENPSIDNLTLKDLLLKLKNLKFEL